MKTIAAVLIAALIVLGASACSTPAGNVAAPTPAQASPAPADETAAPTEPPAETAAKDFAKIGGDLMNIESLGAVQLKMTESQLIAAVGQPDKETTPEVWGADGLKHSDWTYSAKGLTVNMVETTNPESELVVYSIDAKSPCTLATQKGVKIGALKDDALEAYAFAIEDPSDEATKDSIVAGTAYGGIVFGIGDGKITSIFIGAAAE